MWKSIDGYEGYYEVSDDGFVRSVDRVVKRCDGVEQLRRGKVRTLCYDKDGYAVVNLCANGSTERKRVHRLVYCAFVGKIPDGYDVDHKDFDRQNNSVSNLCLMTHGDNVRKTCVAGRHVSCGNISGCKNPNYGNRTLSERYRNDPDYAKTKQSRAGHRNGRCRKTTLVDSNGAVLEFDYIRQCAAYLINSGASASKAESIAEHLKRAAKSGTQFYGYFVNIQ